MNICRTCLQYIKQILDLEADKLTDAKHIHGKKYWLNKVWKKERTVWPSLPSGITYLWR